jgi:glycosyl transferase family 25
MRAVVINLDRSTDRLATFREQAERIGLAFERLPAVDVVRIDFERGALRPGEVACFESHLLAWRMLVDSGEPWLAVFEDDVCLDAAIVPLLSGDDWIPPATDVVKLETFQDGPVVMAPRGRPVPGGRLHRLHSTHLGAAGYIISRDWAAELLRLADGYVLPVDWLLFDLDTDGSPKARILQVVPAPCIQQQWLAAQANQAPLHATLIEGREIKPPKPQQGRASKWRREVRRIGRQIRRLPVTLRKALTPSRRMVVPFGETGSRDVPA